MPANRLEAWARIEAERFADPVFRLFYTELEAVYEEKNRSIDNPFRSVWEAMLSAMWQEHPYGTQTTIGEVDHLKRPSLKAMRAYFDKFYVAGNMALVLSGDFDTEAIMPVIEPLAAEGHLVSVDTRNAATALTGATEPIPLPEGAPYGASVSMTTAP